MLRRPLHSTLLWHKFKALIRLGAPLSILIATQAASAFDHVFCQQLENPECQSLWILRPAIKTCEIEKQIFGCEKLVQEKIIPSDKVMTCNARELCEKHAGIYDPKACLDSFKNFAIEFADLISFIVGGTVQAIQDLNWRLSQFEDQSSDQYRECDLSLKCKRVWFFAANPNLDFISDSDLKKMSLRDLIQDFQFLARREQWFTQARRRPVHAQDPIAVSALDWTYELLSKAAQQGVKLACLSPAAEFELRCYLTAEALGFVGTGAAIKAPAWAGKLLGQLRGINNDRRALSSLTKGEEISSAGASVARRNKFVARYETARVVSDQENQAFLELTHELSRVGNQPQRFVTLEARMKDLNKTYPDKALATTIVNRLKEIFAQEMKVFEPLYSSQSRKGFESYKALDFQAGSGKNALVESELQNVAERTMRRFRDDPELKALLREGDLDREWYVIGYGQSPDFATAAARAGRGTSELGGSGKAFGFESEFVSKVRAEDFAAFKDLQRTLAKKFQNTSLMRSSQTSDGTTLVTFDPRFIDRIRKLPDDERLIAQTLVDFKVHLKNDDVDLIRKYLELVNDFSLNPKPAQRKLVTFKDAIFGGATTDAEGLGSRNLEATARALAESKNHVDAVAKVRQQEQILTASVVKENQTVLELGRKNLGEGSEIVGMNSGDDIGFYANREFTLSEKRAYVKGLASTGNPSGYRVAFFPSRVEESSRILISTRGEEIGSLLRVNLGQTGIPAQKINQLTIGVDMPGRSPGLGAVNILIGKAESVQLNWVDRAAIKQALKRTLREYNRLLESKDMIGSYRYGTLDILP